LDTKCFPQKRAWGAPLVGCPLVWVYYLFGAPPVWGEPLVCGAPHFRVHRVDKNLSWVGLSTWSTTSTVAAGFTKQSSLSE
jgi:hypothetical protein